MIKGFEFTKTQVHLSNNGMTLSEAVRKNTLERFVGGCKEKSYSHLERKKDVTCVMCHRNMTVPKFENQPYYCYQCHDEAEGVFNTG